MIRWLNKRLFRIDNSSYSTLSALVEQHVLNQEVEKRPPGRPIVEMASPDHAAEELADACRSLLFGKKIQQAEVLFSRIVSKQTASSPMDVGLFNIFLEFYLNNDRRSEAANLIRRLGNQADLHTFMLMLKDAIGRGERAEVMRTISTALEYGIPVSSLIGLHGWTKEERSFLSPLLSASILPPDLKEEEMVPFKTFDGIKVEAAPVVESRLPEIARTKSESGGVDLMAAIAASFENMDGNMSVEQLFRAQVKLEEEALRASQELQWKFRQQGLKYTGMIDSEQLFRLRNRWTDQCSDWLRREIETRIDRCLPSATPSQEADHFCALLSAMPVEKVSTIAIAELSSFRYFLPELGGSKLIAIASALGKRIREEMLAHVATTRPFLQRIPIHPAVVKRLVARFHGRRQVEQAMEMSLAQARERQVEDSQDMWLPTWSTTKAVQLGTWLLSGAISAIDIPRDNALSEKPFSHQIVFDHQSGHRQGIIKPNRAVLDMLLQGSSSASDVILSDPWALPMLVPPRPWLTFQSGGYLTRRTTFVRLKDDPVHEEVMKAADAEGLLETVKRGLDVLGSTAWRINMPVLELQIKMWNRGIDLTTLRPFVKIAFQEAKPRPTDYQSFEEYTLVVKEWFKMRQKKGEQLSLRCDQNYKLEIAKMFSGVPRFYLPHSVDFRGRAYTVPPHLSHISSDSARGLLLFADGVPLGERGLFWLQVHLSNMHGFDKASLEGRVAYCQKHLSDILECAADPEANDFWKRGEEPWQCLAACIELKAALDHAEGPAAFNSRLPVQQDGSCNGLQHYAALGGDPEGAAKVNLAPSPAPQDVYRSVADLVAARIKYDLNSPNADDRKCAEALDNKINRKIVKTTVMTNVYGVTEYGAREQLSAKLLDAGLFVNDDEGLALARSYLARLVFASLKELFVNAKRIQDWLTAAAEEIVHAIPEESAVMFGYSKDREVTDPSKFCQYYYRRPEIAEEHADNLDSARKRMLAKYPQSMVSWTTPLNFVVVQPYARNRVISLLTSLQRVSVRSPGPTDPVDPLKQSSAFSPNYIHSLDATHMFMSALECNRRGITFASVHDCFWTHAGSVDIMSRVIREQFVELYSKSVLEKTREEFGVRYGGYKVSIRGSKGKGGNAGSLWRPIYFPPVPKRGPFDLKVVLDSLYFFS